MYIFNNFFNDKNSSDNEVKEKENPSYFNSSFNNQIMIIFNDMF